MSVAQENLEPPVADVEGGDEGDGDEGDEGDESEEVGLSYLLGADLPVIRCSFFCIRMHLCSRLTSTECVFSFSIAR